MEEEQKAVVPEITKEEHDLLWSVINAKHAYDLSVENLHKSLILNQRSMVEYMNLDRMSESEFVLRVSERFDWMRAYKSASEKLTEQERFVLGLNLRC